MGVGAERIDFGDRASEYRKQYSVWYYLWMKEHLGIDEEIMGKVIGSNNVNWAAEHIFKVNYREYRLNLRNGVLYSPDFGGKTLLQMADDAILIREKAGANLDRTQSEKRGIEKLQEMFGRIKVGETVVLMSPTDPNDPDMGGYSMVYVYEKQENDQIRATAIRNDEFKIDDLRVLANYLSGVNRWNVADHMDFVAKPFITRLSFEKLVVEIGVSRKDVLPSWVEEMSASVVRAMLFELGMGRVEKMKEIFDAFQMSVKTRYEYEKEKMGDQDLSWIDPVRMSHDEGMWLMVQRQFLERGGREMMSGGGSCGRPDLDIKTDPLRSNNVMSDLVGVNEREDSYSFDHEGKCVVCKQDPRMLGPCGICEECDHKIRAQVE